jgi:TonB family protein
MMNILGKRHRRHPVVAAFILSLAINLGIIFGLGTLHAQDQLSFEKNQVVVPMSIVDAPPPPPPQKKEDAQDSQLLAAASALPPLELPPTASDMGAIEMPKTDPNDYGWSLEIDMPNFSGRGSKDLKGLIGSQATPPILMYQPSLAAYYPGRARRAQITGKTQMVLDLDPKGQVVKVQITTSTPQGVFERSARRAAQKLRYKPSIRNGRPQSSKVSMEFIWTLN